MRTDKGANVAKLRALRRYRAAVTLRRGRGNGQHMADIVIRVGASGFSYKPWKGIFYPAGLPDAQMLAFYAGELPTVEINNTFYRMPKVSVLEGWAEKTPPDFRFVLKASRRITHQMKLKDTKEATDYFFVTAKTLGARLGPVLFQLPPYLRKDADRLAAFLASLPSDAQVAMEFRHASWLDDEIFGLLRDANAALCLTDTDDAEKRTPFEVTADWGYLRLRKTGYDDADLRAWAEKLRTQPWREVYVFFKHEAHGPDYAKRLMAACGC